MFSPIVEEKNVEDIDMFQRMQDELDRAHQIKSYTLDEHLDTILMIVHEEESAFIAEDSKGYNYSISKTTVIDLQIDHYYMCRITGKEYKDERFDLCIALRKVQGFFSEEFD